MGDLLINLLASAIFYLFGLLTKWVVTRVKTLGQRRFWAPFLKSSGPLAVVLTDKTGDKPRSPKKISLTDVIAYSDVRSVLSLLGRQVEIKVRSEADMAQLARDCFISLGGPLANGISGQVLARLESSLPVKFNDTTKCFEYAGASFCASYGSDQRVERDYGLIIRLLRLDPADVNSKAALVVFGLHGHGTQQAVQAINNNHELATQLKPLLTDDLFALLEFRFSDHKCTSRTVVTVGRIAR